MPKWTPEQQNAISLRDSNLLVSAAAGSGKTAVMIERIYQLLVDGNSIDRMMVVTFTNLAAASMLEKLAQRLDKALEEDPANEHLSRQRSLLERADISTIHSFCMKILKRYYFKTNLPPDFRLLDKTQEEMLCDAAMRQILEEASLQYMSNDFPEYAEALTQFAGKKDDNGLVNAIRALAKNVESMPDPYKLLNQIPDEKSAEKQWQDALMDSYKTDLRAAIDYLKEIEKVFTEIEPKTMEYVANYTDLFQAALNETTPEGMLNVLDNATTKQLRGVCPNFKYSVHAVAKLRTDMVKALKSHVSFKSIDVQGAVKALFILTKNYMERRKELMLEQSGVTFSDLLHTTLELFRNYPDILNDLRESIDYIFVDEYQDVNILLNTIVESLAKGDNLFMVGDIKQCIYGFQLARPDLFSKKIQEYENGVIGKCVVLKNNFRSNFAILEAVNALFTPLMTNQTAILPYDDNAKLCHGPDQNELQNQPSFFCNGKPERPCELMLSLDNNESEMIARRILELRKNCTLKEKVKVINDKGETEERIEERDVTYKDIAILVRSNKLAREIADYLNNQDIPAIACDPEESEQSECDEVLSLLRVLLLKRKDLDLINVMMREFSATELVKIRVAANKDGLSFYDACLQYDGDPAIKEKISTLLENLERLSLLSRAMSLPNFLEYLLENEGYRYTAAASENGASAEKALDQLVSAARAYTEFGKGGLRGFLRYYEKYRPDDKKSITMNDSDDVVRLMTIHKSKGLEFPVVILAGTQEDWNGNGSDAICFDEDLGIGFCPSEQDEYGVRTKAAFSLSKAAINDHKMRKEKQEELRLLYVALTRAQNKLILSMAKKTKMETFVEYFRLPGDLITLRANNYAALLLPLLYYHKDGLPFSDLTEDVAPDLIESGSWAIKIWPEGTFAVPDEESPSSADANAPHHQASAEKNETEDRQFSPDEYLENAKQAFAWAYPYEAAIRARTKQNPSKNEMRPKIDLRHPAFKDEAYDGAKKGTVVHAFMEHVDFASDENARTQAERMNAAGILSDEEFAVLPFGKLDAFLTSPIGQRLKKSPQINRERSFCLIVPFPETGDEALIQGIIDCYFFEGNNIILLDYKTDHIQNNLEDRKAHHKPQLQAYQRALEQMYPGKTVTPYLYFFSVDKLESVI